MLTLCVGQVVDDELNILSISNHVRSIEPVYISEDAEKSPEEKELAELKATLRDTNPVGPLLSICKTLDQARVSFIAALGLK